MKKFCIFIVLAFVLVVSPVYADDGLVVNPNPFPVLINGVVTEVEAFNINGYTYLKLADMSKAGLEVKFNETLRRIEIFSAQMIPPMNTPREEGEKNMQEPEVPLNKYGLPDFTGWTGSFPKAEREGGYLFFTYKGVRYLCLLEFPSTPRRIVPDNFRFRKPVINGRIGDIIVFEKENSETGEWEILIDEVPYSYMSAPFIPYDYYLNTILPLTQEAE
jgi:hypothetical protein